MKYFFQLIVLFKIAHLKHFWCQQRVTPEALVSKHVQKNAIILDGGKREVAWEPKLYIYSSKICMFHVNHRRGSWGPTGSVPNFEMMQYFFPIKFYIQNCSFEAFLVPTKGNPQNHWFNSICKKCNNPRSGHRESCFGSETVDLFHVNEFQSRDNKWKQPEPDCRKCCDMKIMVNLFPLVGAMYSPVPC